MVRSMMSFTELPPSFWGYTLETAAKLLNIAPSKSVPQTPYEIWHGKPASYMYLRVWDSPAYVKRLVGGKLDSRSSLCSRHDAVLVEESNEEPHRDTRTSFEPTVHTDSVPIHVAAYAPTWHLVDLDVSSYPGRQQLKEDSLARRSSHKRGVSQGKEDSY
ncbi:UNVERIFIED_CONTAM: hypothetical protein Slati_2501100 [Sesamum latifolium]|uniref:Retrotransposon protein n=1 Tax=Sesamum latifolium TaxID=2727402 RepID=A0AAW2WG02_9LAMI